VVCPRGMLRSDLPGGGSVRSTHDAVPAETRGAADTARVLPPKGVGLRRRRGWRGVLPLLLGLPLLVLPACRRGEPSAPQTREFHVEYRPEWLSPDGRLLLVTAGPPRMLGRGLVLDVTNGAEVWRPPEEEPLILLASWSPRSDAICWSTPAKDPRDQILYANIPKGAPVALLHRAPADLRRDLLYNVCFGESPEEVLVGACRLGLPGNQRTVFFALDTSRGADKARVTTIVRAASGADAQMPIQMTRVGDGQRVLVVDGVVHSVRGVYLANLARGSFAPVVSESTPEVATLRAARGDQLDELSWVRLVPWPDSQRWAFGLRTARTGCDVFTIEGEDQMRVTHVGFAALALPEVAPLPGAEGYVIAVADSLSAERVQRPEDVMSHLYVFDATLKRHQRLTEAPARDDCPLWSKAAGRVVFRRHETEIWSVSLAGGEPTRLWAPPTTSPE
jgi:hypothetical protein